MAKTPVGQGGLQIIAKIMGGAARNRPRRDYHQGANKKDVLRKTKNGHFQNLIALTFVNPGVDRVVTLRLLLEAPGLLL